MKQVVLPSFTVFGEPRHDCAVRAACAPDNRSRQRPGRRRQSGNTDRRCTERVPTYWISRCEPGWGRCWILQFKAVGQCATGRKGRATDAHTSGERKDIHHERGDQTNWRREVGSFEKELREDWERAVEDAVSPVLKRLSRKIQTDGLIKLTVLNNHDCVTMREAYGRC